jgi:hypothetical protein
MLGSSVRVVPGGHLLTTRVVPALPLYRIMGGQTGTSAPVNQHLVVTDSHQPPYIVVDQVIRLHLDAHYAMLQKE